MVTALAFAAALCAALFFNGTHLTALAASLGALIAGTAVALARRHARGIELPRSALAAALTLFWSWIGLSVLWSEVPYASAVNFWWVGTLPLGFWLYTFTPERERTWRGAGAAALAVGLALAVYGVWQTFAEHLQARSLFLNPNSHAAFLNLILLPTTGRWMIAAARGRGRAERWGWAAAVAVLAFGVALVHGRGATLTLAIGLVLLTVLVRRSGLRAGTLAPALTVVGAFALANLLLHGGLAGRLETLFNPASAGANRFIIWSGAWRMYLQHPWFGTGLGTFWLAWPPFRNPADTSGGFYVHNDYLQIAIETGVFGAALLLAVLGATLGRFRAAWRAQPEPARRVELASLFAALVTLATHSFLTFNLYILPITIVAGMVLGRLHDLSTHDAPVPRLALHPARRLGAPAYGLIVALAALLPLSYFGAMALSQHYAARAQAQARAGHMARADSDLLRAIRLTPGADALRVARADLLREVLRRTTGLTQAGRRALFRAAAAELAAAQRIDPLRPQVFYVRARLLEEHPRLAGPAWAARVRAAYGHALRLNPRYARARTREAAFLLRRGERAKARALLAAGLREWYYPDPPVLTYYALTEQVLAADGDTRAAARVRRRLADGARELRRALRAAGIPTAVRGTGRAPAEHGS